MFPLTPQVIAAILVQLGTANPVSLLLAAEAGAAAVASANPGITSGLWLGACRAVAASIGYPLGNYAQTDQNTICNVIGGFMRGLAYLAQGPSLAVPNGTYFNFIL
jgi:hypothetical protein